MAIALDAEPMLAVAGGVLLVVLGAWVLRVRARLPARGAFAAFAILFGARLVLNNLLTPEDPARPVTAWGVVVTTYLAVLALARLAVLIPTPLPPEERRLLAAAALVASPLFLAITARTIRTGAYLDAATHYDLSAYTLGALGVGVAFLIALRHRRRPHPASPLAAAAVVLYAAVNVGDAVIYFERNGGTPTVFLGGLLATALAAAGWGVMPRSIEPRGRWLALWILAAVLFGMADTSFELGLFGLTQIVSVLLFAWAILRHQMLGLDVKVRWALSRSTVAAAFVAVFFVASEGAQLVFGSTNAWIGLAAAATLVFALTPLQRSAERLARQVVPLTDEPPPSGREGLYREQLAIAWSDGRVSPKERLLLTAGREHLGLSAEEADAVERAYLAERMQSSP